MRVLVLGAGYAGVVLTRVLEDRLSDDVELVVVDESGHHLVQHELHRTIRRPGIADSINIPLGELFDRATVRQETVVDIDTGGKAVELSDGERLSYDVAAVCLGARTNFYGMQDVEVHAYSLKRLSDTTGIREDLDDAFDEGAAAPRLVVGGAGLAGVQLAGEFAAYAAERSADASVAVLEQADRVAPKLSDRFGAALHDELTDRGVEVRTGTTVTGASSTSVELEHEADEPYDVLVWTGGIRGPSATDGERVDVRADLALDDHTFVLGDTARVVDADGAAVPPTAQAAVREARIVAGNIASVVDSSRSGDGLPPRLDRFTFDSPGWLVSVGDGAVAQLGTSILRGRAARALELGVGAGYLASSGAVAEAVSFVRAEYERRPDD